LRQSLGKKNQGNPTNKTDTPEQNTIEKVGGAFQLHLATENIGSILKSREGNEKTASQKLGRTFGGSALKKGKGHEKKESPDTEGGPPNGTNLMGLIETLGSPSALT